MKRIYISGPMTGMPELNFQAFHAEAARLKCVGNGVVALCAAVASVVLLQRAGIAKGGRLNGIGE